MKNLALTVLVFILTVTAHAQTDKEKVIQVVNTYFKGYTAGDTIMLKEAFHPDFHLSWISPWHKGDEAFKQVDRAGLLAFFGPDWSNLEIESRLDATEVGNSSATAKATVTLKGIVVWTDYLSLLKINERWWIVSKISEGKKLPKTN